MAEGPARLAVTVRLASPLAVSERRPGGQAATGLDYIPGARLRGAVADVLLRQGECPAAHRDEQGCCAAEDCAIGRLLTGAQSAQFRDALPLGASEVLPATAMTCAVLPGFQVVGAADQAHGVFDTLLDRALWEILAPSGLLYEPTCPARRCGAPAERFEGFYGRQAIGGKLAYVAGRVPSRLLARAGVDRQRGAGSDDLAYTVPVIAEATRTGADPTGPLARTTFHGEVLLADQGDYALLADALRRVTRLGGGRSRGFGVVEVAVETATPAEPLGARLERFTRAMVARRGQYARLAPLSVAALEGSFFCLTLQSDAVLRRGGWEPTTVLDAELLQAYARVDDPTLSLVRTYAQPAWRGGWQVAWGLPRPPEAVARRGSCYLYRTSNLAAWTAALDRLELVGVGERTADGFGQALVCDPFHLNLRDQAV
jgi:CRISPR-associated protein Csx10